MAQTNMFRDITSTVAMFGLTVVMLSQNNSSDITLENNLKLFSNNYDCYFGKSNINSLVRNEEFIVKKSLFSNPLNKLSFELFGHMREVTPEEKRNVTNYIKSISKPTGVNFFDLC